MQDTHQSQNGSGEGPESRGLTARRRVAFSQHFASGTPRPSRGLSRPGFTLTELLIVIAIIAVLASLITAAAVNALRAGKRTQILLEAKQMEGAAADFKADYGAYPPSGSNDGSHTRPGGVTQLQTLNDFTRMFKKAFPRMDPQEMVVVQALAGRDPSQITGANSNNKVTSAKLANGINAEEAVYFWLGGFSDDPQYPISGPGGPSFDTSSSQGEVLENRKRRYEFDLGRLVPRQNGVFSTSGRSITYTIVMNGTNQTRRINLWEYVPKGSEKPFVYFDVSRYKPAQYDPPAEVSPPGDPDVAKVYAIKSLREGKSAPTDFSDIAFANFGKCQILHAGLDGVWGTNFGGSASSTGPNGATSVNALILYPTGPFVGDAADTLTSFADGTLADAQENK